MKELYILIIILTYVSEEHREDLKMQYMNFLDTATQVQIVKELILID